ncbi:MAG: AmmeMemoRadiSam system radical SAM enzyme [Desulfomonilaceae bacterium]
MIEAALYEKTGSNALRCKLCRQSCKIEDGERGFCGVRENRGGTLFSLVYDKIVSTNVDPIEKKPFFHFAPGSKSFSIATMGCNFRCSFCQNYSISQPPHEKGEISGVPYTPEQIVSMAVEADCKSIAYTYTEPTVYYELARDTMILAKKAGLLNVFVTNGYMSREMLDDARGLIDGANVDLKAFDDNFYTQYCKARLKGVLDSLKYIKGMGIWLEVTTLLIPGLNDNTSEIKEMARFIKNELGRETPWHVSRFFPRYKELGLPPTEASVLRGVRQIGLDEGLYYVYTGNLPWEPGESTYCPGCSYMLIDRVGYTIQKYALKERRCPKCGYEIEGVEL